MNVEGDTNFQGLRSVPSRAIAVNWLLTGPLQEKVGVSDEDNPKCNRTGISVCAWDRH